MRVLTGTMGYSFKEWKGTFYPKNVKNEEMLGLYAEHFNAVELNSTFYRMPKADTFVQWKASVPDDFTFIVKASRRITHFSRLQDTPGSSVSFLLKMASNLGSKLGPLLFQCPPNFAKNAERLRTFLPSIPADRPAVFEFRNASWFDEEIEEIIREAGLALCSVDDEGDDPAESPIFNTCDWGYFRFHREVYTRDQLVTWADRIADMKGTWNRVHMFFNHEADGIQHAKDMHQLVLERL